MDVWMCGCLGVSVHGCMDARVYGRMGAWIYGGYILFASGELDGSYEHQQLPKKHTHAINTASAKIAIVQNPCAQKLKS